MARESICVDVDNADDVNAAEGWLEAYRDQLSYLSENQGCGCCVDEYDLEGPEEVLRTIPWRLRCCTPWTRGQQE